MYYLTYKNDSGGHLSVCSPIVACVAELDNAELDNIRVISGVELDFWAKEKTPVKSLS